MGRHTTGKHARYTRVGSAAVACVLALTGMLLATNLRVNRSVTVSSDTADLVEQRVKYANDLQKEINDLSSQINTLSETLGNGTSQSTGEDAGSGTLLKAVEGPGVTVTLDDSPLWQNAVDGSGSSADIDAYVIHQQDIEAVVNALWAGGAESMMIMDQRVLSNSAVRCVGNVLLLQGKKYSPPFKISAIGPTDSMLKALDDSTAINIYKQYVSAFGLGWDVTTKEKLRFDQTDAVLQPLQYASVQSSGEEDTSADSNAATDAGASDATVNGGKQ